MDNKSVRLEVRVWYDEKTRHIKLCRKGTYRIYGEQWSRQRALPSQPIRQALQGSP